MKILAVLIACLVAGPALAASGTDPTWPCIQPKQPRLSLGQVWAGPVPDQAVLSLAADPRIADLADRLEQRRLPIEQAEKDIADFARDADAARLTALMQAIFDRIESERSALIAGIARYGQKQVALAKMIEDRRSRMARLEAEEKALDWDQRIFTERQKSLTYVCETPVILEQRVFALARAIASHLP